MLWTRMTPYAVEFAALENSAAVLAGQMLPAAAACYNEIGEFSPFCVFIPECRGKQL